MNVLVACEFSAVVRDAFIARGHDAWSCDLLDSEGRQGNHLKGDVLLALGGSLHRFPHAINIRTGNTPVLRRWDLLIAHPPCTYLANSGVRWLYEGGKKSDVAYNRERWHNMQDGANFFIKLLHANISRIAVENPIMHRHAHEFGIPKATQIIQPWQFGHGETKATCLWLKNLPPLQPTNIVSGREPRAHHASPGPERWKERSRTLKGIADAMAEQWGCL